MSDVDYNPYDHYNNIKKRKKNKFYDINDRHDDRYDDRNKKLKDNRRNNKRNKKESKKRKDNKRNKKEKIVSNSDSSELDSSSGFESNSIKSKSKNKTSYNNKIKDDIKTIGNILIDLQQTIDSISNRLRKMENNLSLNMFTQNVIALKSSQDINKEFRENYKKLLLIAENITNKK